MLNKAMLHRQQAGWTNFPWFVLRFNATLAQKVPLQICRKWRRYMDKVIHLIEFLRREFIKCLKL